MAITKERYFLVDEVHSDMTEFASVESVLTCVKEMLDDGEYDVDDFDGNVFLVVGKKFTIDASKAEFVVKVGEEVL